MFFDCVWQHDNGIDEWDGYISQFKKSNGHYEMLIESRSSLRVVFGTSSFGGFACMPDFQVSCYLVNLKDRFWNTEKLVSVLGSVDGITVATALYCISDSVEY